MLAWYPAETDVSIRPGWFYHAKQDAQVKTPEKLVDIYFSSVGRNGLLLLNVPPDTRGRIADADVKSLLGMRAAFSTARSPRRRRGPAAEAGARERWRAAAYEVPVRAGRAFDVAFLQEDIRQGQRVEHSRSRCARPGRMPRVREGRPSATSGCCAFPR